MFPPPLGLPGVSSLPQVVFILWNPHGGGAVRGMMGKSCHPLFSSPVVNPLSQAAFFFPFSSRIS